MRCKWLQEVVFHSVNGTPPHVWSPEFWGPGVVIVMLLRPPDRLWRIVFDGSIDKHVAASFFIPLTSFSPEAFLKEVLGNQTATLSPTEGTYYSQQETPLSSVQHIFFMTTYAMYFIFRRFYFGDAFWCFWRSGELKSGNINNSCMPYGWPTSECVYAYACERATKDSRWHWRESNSGHRCQSDHQQGNLPDRAFGSICSGCVFVTAKSKTVLKRDTVGDENKGKPGAVVAGGQSAPAGTPWPSRSACPVTIDHA